MSEHHISPDGRIALRLHDMMLADDLSPGRANMVTAQLLAQLAKHDQLAHLYVYSIRDHMGALHVCVGRDIPDGGQKVYALSVEAMRSQEFRDVCEEVEIAARLNHEGTEI